MRLLFSLVLFIISINLYSQVRAEYEYISDTAASISHYRLQGFIVDSDGLGFGADSIPVDSTCYFIDAGGNIFQIVGKSGSSPLKLDVNRVGHSNAPQTGIGQLTVSSEKYGMYYTTGGVNDKLENLIEAINIGKLESGYPDGSQTFIEAGNNISISGTGTSGDPYTIIGSAGSAGDTTYSAGNGAYVTATGPGVTFTRSTGTEGLFEIPDGIEVTSCYIHHTSAQNPGTVYYVQFDFQGTRLLNNDLATLAVPYVTVLNKIVSENNSNIISRSSPVNYAQTSGSINMELKITGLDPLEIQINNYNDSRVGGSGGTMICIIW